MFDRHVCVGWCGRSVLGTLLVAALAWSAVVEPSAAQESEFAGLIRSKQSDRGSYQAPTLPRQSPPHDPAAGLDELPWAYGEVTGELPDQVMPASYVDAPVYEYPADAVLDAGCGAEVIGGCDGACDSLCGGCGRCRGYPGLFGLGGMRICGDSAQWFGSVELLLMFRSGDRLPILATTSASGLGDGALPVGPPGDTRVLFGGERVLQDMTAGGRFTIGTWLDDYHCRSLVFRGWGTGDESFRFDTDSSRNAVIARPFLNVSGAAPMNDSLVIASPALDRTGSLSIRGSSEVYGGDLAIRQLWMAGLGGVVEVLYGYQHMRLREDLDITSSFLDLPNVVDARDRFAAENEFHGGEIGLATRYREGCWSFNGLIKVAAGSVRRTATLDGSTTIGPPAVTTPEGLLVRGSNAGQIRNSTFGWVPELDATLGYRYTRNLDFTIGYHVIAMTDALQVSGMIDPQLAVNSDFPTGPARPGVNLRFDTFHVQGIHFGLQYVY